MFLFQFALKTIQVVAMVLGCLPDLGERMLVLKTQCTWVTGHAETKLILTRKPPPGWLDFPVPAGALWASAVSYLSLNYELQ